MFIHRKDLQLLATAACIGFILILSGCSDSDNSTHALNDDLDPPAAQSIVGEVTFLDNDVSANVFTVSGYGEFVGLEDSELMVSGGGATVTLDGGDMEWPLDDHGRFTLSDVIDGDHSLFIHSTSGVVIEVPFRMLSSLGLNLGMVTVSGNQVESISGFDGYRFGFSDEDGDGINDHCVDNNGDGYCDEGCRYANYTYLTTWGFIDENEDGKNDRYWDGDGDGRNDLDGSPNGWGFGFVDENDDGMNDRFCDGDGNGICDQTGMPYRVNYNWIDQDENGINDLFTDADGDGINDINFRPYVAMPGWVDEDGDGINDRFQDADGNGICDTTGIAYAHGFGWVDEDGDGVNDHYRDGNGDAINDCQQGPYAEYHYRHGFLGPHVDNDGDGIADGVGINLRDGFGWLDIDADGVNDTFTDCDGDGVNDQSEIGYIDGFKNKGEEKSPGFDDSCG